MNPARVAFERFRQFEVFQQPESGPDFARAYLAVIATSSDTELEADGELFFGRVFLNVVANRRADMKARPEIYRPLMQAVLDALVARGAPEHVLLGARTFVGFHLPGFMDDATLCETALRGWQAVHGRADYDPHRFFHGDGKFVRALERTAKKAGRGKEPAIVEIIAGKKALQRDALRELREDHPGDAEGKKGGRRKSGKRG